MVTRWHLHIAIEAGNIGSSPIGNDFCPVSEMDITQLCEG